jgi:hypothetical protein
MNKRDKSEQLYVARELDIRRDRMRARDVMSRRDLARRRSRSRDFFAPKQEPDVGIELTRANGASTNSISTSSLPNKKYDKCTQRGTAYSQLANVFGDECRFIGLQGHCSKLEMAIL